MNTRNVNARNAVPPRTPRQAALSPDEVQLVRFFLGADTRYLFVALQIEEFRHNNGRTPSSGELEGPTLGLFDDRTLRRMLARWRQERADRALPAE